MSIGMPTYNGERFIREALDSLMAQDYPNFEILISDNASTDATASIVDEYAGRDRRVRVIHQPINLEAAANFNCVVRETGGPYFMWAADDDRWHPGFVSLCVDALEASPEAVMAAPSLRFIDDDGNPVHASFAYDNPDLSGSLVARVRTLVCRGGWYQVYGLSRRTALERTPLLQNGYGADVVLTMRMALAGPILKVPEVLFWYRQRAGTSEASRVRRQGGIADEGRVLQAKYTHLEESLSRVVLGSSLPALLRLRLVGEIVVAAYLANTPLSRHTSLEVGVRLRRAIRDRHAGEALKFGALVVVRRVIDGLRRLRRLARRVRP